MAAASRRRGKQPSGRGAQPPRPAVHPRVWTFAVLGIILAVSVLRAMHLGFPLERDEGEFGYIAQELLRGARMYETAYTQKLPGTYLVYALVLSVFGQTLQAIHLGLLLANAAIMALLFLLLRRTHNGLAGSIAALVFGITAMSPGLLGFAAHATIFVALFATGGLYVLLLARERDRAALYLASGLCFGLAFLMKQSGVFFAPLALAALVADRWTTQPRRLGRIALQALTFGAGAAAPILLTFAYYLAIGKFSAFWFWTVQFAGEFAGQVGRAEALKFLLEGTGDATAGFEILWILSIVGLGAVLRDSTLGRTRVFYLAFLVAGVLAVVPGFYFTNHYYLTALPAVALLVGALGGGRGPARRRPIVAGVWVLTAAGLVLGIAKHGSYYFGSESDAAISRKIYGGNPFPESVEIGEYLKRHTTQEDRIAVLGSETQIYFYAQRRAASRFVNAYFLMAHHARNRDMQHEMIRDIEQARPKYMVTVFFPSSWMRKEDSPMDIFDWITKYRQGYSREGVLELYADRTISRWGPDAQAPRKSNFVIEVLRRNDSTSE